VGAPAIVHLIGFPAAGKLTIARALAEVSAARGDRFVVLDNHHTANVVFAAIDMDGVKPLPPEVWDRIREINAVLLRTIEELSPSDWSFVFTNVLTDEEPSDRGYVDRLANLAHNTNRIYLPVLLQCPPASLMTRVANPDRRDRMKLVNPTAVDELVRTHRLINVDDLAPLTIDTSSIEPADAARLILERLNDSDH
jgi:chloramphenicol 3-O-phosphotransferase